MSGAEEGDGVLEREALFHDRLVEGLDPREAPPAAPDMWEEAILQALTPVAGAAVLDYGCGDGNLSLHLAGAGARVITGIDISPATVSFAARRLQVFAPEAQASFIAGDATETGLPSESFDLIAGKFILHHLDLGAALSEVKRLLKPGGRAVFIETSGLNPALSLARRHLIHSGRLHAVKYGTDDERPLALKDVRLIRKTFPGATVDFPVFFFWRLYNRNVLVYRSDAWSRRLNGWDEAVERRLRFLGPMSYFMRISVTR
jgi:SAM-dependent methyltransferase